MAKPSHSEAHSGATAAPPSASPANETIGQGVKSVFDELSAPEISQRVLKLALKQLNRLIALEPKVLRGESIEAVHDLRVASRRLQGLVDFLCTAPASGGIRKVRRRLKKAREALGELRNQDVMAWRIERALARKRISHRAAWEAAQDYVSKLRPKAEQRAHRKLTKLNLSALYIRLRAELQERCPVEPADAPRVITFPEESATADPVTAIEQSTDRGSTRTDSAGRFSRRLDELWRDFTAKAAKAQDVGALHPLRIAAKKVRYLVEVVADLDVAGSREALAWLQELQGRLGDWHDYQVLGTTMLEMVARRDFLEKHLPLAIEVEKLVLKLRSSKTRSCERYLRQAFKSQEYRRTAQWVSQCAASPTLPTA